MLPILLVAVAAFGSALSPLLARALTPVAGLVGARSSSSSPPCRTSASSGGRGPIGDFFFRAETAACPGGGPPPTPEYYDCLSERMWTRHPILIDALGGAGTAGGAVTVALVTLVVVGCLVRFRSEAAERLSTPRGR